MIDIGELPHPDSLTVRERACEALAYGAAEPFDGPADPLPAALADRLQHNDEPIREAKARPARDWAHRAARGVMAELQGRARVKDALADVPEHLARDVVDVMAEIIRLAESRRRKRG